MAEYATRQDVEGIRQDLRIHTSDDREFQERIFNYLGKSFDKMNGKLDSLWDEKNQREGQESSAKNFGEKSKTKFSVAGFAINAGLNLALVIATIKMLK